MSEEIQQTNPDWYKDLQYQDVKVYIRDNINSASRSFVAIGYYLKYVRDNQLFLEDGYTTIWEFAQGEFSIGKSSASRFMAINDRFSNDGNSPILLEQYRDFSSSKLSEMLTMSDDQLEQVSVTTTVAEIREIKNPVKDEVVATSQQETECFIKKDLTDGLMCSGGISDNCNTCDRYDPVETELDEPKLIDDLDFTVRTYNCLKRAGIDTIDDLCGLTEDKAIAIRNVSRKCLDEINEKVSAIGKSLKSDITEIVSIESEYIETVTNETEENRIPDPDLSCKFDPDAKCLTASKESCKRINDDRCMYSSGWDEEDYIIAELDVELDPVETVEADIVQSEPEDKTPLKKISDKWYYLVPIGANDITGKAIREGDILEWANLRGEIKMYQVYYEQRSFSFHPCEVDRVGTDTLKMIPNNKLCTSRIIRNVHEGEEFIPEETIPKPEQPELPSSETTTNARNS